jgi:hypothetical protein
VQAWLKVMHRWTGRDRATFGDPHRLGAHGEPLMRPAYEPGDRALIYLAGTYRCPALVEIVAPASYDAGQSRWGWRTEVRLLLQAPSLELAPTLEDIGVARISVGRQSRLRLRREQLDAGRRALEEASG